MSDAELKCEDPYLRTVEKQMLWIIRHAEEIGDDIVIEPCFHLDWDVEISDYGVRIEDSHAMDSRGHSLAYSFNNPIRSQMSGYGWSPRRLYPSLHKALLNSFFLIWRMYAETLDLCITAAVNPFMTGGNLLGKRYPISGRFPYHRGVTCLRWVKCWAGNTSSPVS